MNILASGTDFGQRGPFVSDWIQAGVGKEGLEWGQGSENPATERGNRRAWARR